MKKIYRLEDLECAVCAGKMEVNVNFLTQKLTLVADDEKFESIVDEAVKICKKIEPDCRIIRK